MNNLPFKLYLLSLTICFLCSLIAFMRSYPPHLRLFSVFLGITILTEFIAWQSTHYFHARSNHMVYNIFMLLEYCLYALFFRALIRRPRARRFVDIFLIVFPIVWAATTFSIFRLIHWNSYVDLLGDAATTILCILYFSELFTSDDLRNFAAIPEFWIAAATFIYCCCELPFTGMLNYLAANYESVALMLKMLMQVLNIVMYGIIAIAYLLPLFINSNRSKQRPAAS